MVGGIILGMDEMLIILAFWKAYKVISIREIRSKKWIFLLLALTVGSIFINVEMLSCHHDIYGMINLSILYVLMAVIAGIDYQKKVIPNVLLGIGIIIRIILIFAQGIIEGTLQQEIVYSGIGFGFGLVVLLLVSFLTKRGIGYGDVKMFAWIGLCIGAVDTFSILFYSAFFAALAGTVCLLFFKTDKHHKMAFAPFVFAAVYAVYIMSFASAG